MLLRDRLIGGGQCAHSIVRRGKHDRRPDSLDRVFEKMRSTEVVRCGASSSGQSSKVRNFARKMG
jgi:hypothetical protein